MRLDPNELRGVRLIQSDKFEDSRGSFVRLFCEDQQANAGFEAHVSQVNLSRNHRAGTLRGMHLQRPPHGETKLIRCLKGAIYDVVVDVRRDSLTFMHWAAVHLDESSDAALYVPEGLAHGFLTLTDAAEVLYVMGAPFVSSAAMGYRYDDPAFGIDWPVAPAVISDRDLNFAPFQP